MQSSGSRRDRRHVVTPWLARAVRWWSAVLRALSLSAALRLGELGPSLGLPVHLAAASAVRATRAPAGSDAEAGEKELIDPQVVEHVRAAQEGNAYAFSMLYELYVDKVYSYCYHRTGSAQVAEDLTSDVFMKALKRINTFSWQGKDFGAWLITIARNRCHDHFKSGRFRLETSVGEVYDDVDNGPSYDAQPERNLELAELRSSVREAMGQLKSAQAEVLYHRFLQGYDVPTTARVMGKKEPAIRALQYRALKALAKHVDVEALLG